MLLFSVKIKSRKFFITSIIETVSRVLRVDVDFDVLETEQSTSIMIELHPMSKMMFGLFLVSRSPSPMYELRIKNIDNMKLTWFRHF